MSYKLDYDENAGALRRRRRVKRIVLIAVTVLTVVFLCIFWNQIRRTVMARYYLSVCSRHQAEPHSIAFEDQPVPATATANSREYNQFLRGRFQTRLRLDEAFSSLCRVCQWNPWRTTNHTPVFVHNRKSPDGEEMLVVVNMLIYPTPQQRMVAFDVYLIKSGNMISMPKMVLASPGMPTPIGSNVLGFTVFEGSADPQDESHFSIPFAVGADEGLIEGWLKTGRIVELRATKGSLESSTETLVNKFLKALLPNFP